MRRLRLTDPELLRLLMRWSRGGPLSVRAVAGAAAVSKSKIHDLVTGTRCTTVTPEVADRIAQAVHVDRDSLFLPASSTSMDADDRR